MNNKQGGWRAAWRRAAGSARAALLALLVGATLAPAHGADALTKCDRSKSCCREDTLGGDPQCAGAGNPIDVVTGNKYQREVDLPALPGLLGIEIVRHYNSDYSRASDGNGLLGRGWRLSYEIDLADAGSRITIMQADGTPLHFTRGMLDTQIYSATDPAHGRVSVAMNGRAREYLWRQLSGRQLGFDARGKLAHITLPSGEFVSLTRDPRGLLQKVTDPQGRSLVFHYPDRATARAGDRFRGVVAIDTPVGRFDYAYGQPPPAAQGDARAVISTLVQVTLPGADSAQRTRRLYHYEDPRFPTLLTGISVQGQGSDGRAMNERIATYGYDAQGRGNLTVKGVPARYKPGHDGQSLKPLQPEPGTGIEQVTLDFSQPGRTIATNSLGQQTVFTHRLIAGQPRLAEVRGAGCAHCPGPNERYGYDTFGRMNETTRITADGQPIETLRTDFDTLGRPKLIVRVDYAKGKAQPARTLARYGYGAYLQPTLVARPSVVPEKEHLVRTTYNEAGQVLRVMEEGFSPVDASGRPGAMAISRTVSYAYTQINGRSLLTQIDGPLPNGAKVTPGDSDITRFEWDVRGSKVVQIVSPMNWRTRFTYDDVDRVAQVAFEDQRITAYRYDAFSAVVDFQETAHGRLIRHLSFRHHPSGQIAEAFEHFAGQAIPLARQEFDIAGRLRWNASGEGVLRQAAYDSESRLLTSTVAAGSILQQERYTYDADGRLVRVEDNSGSSRDLLRDANGKLVASVDPLGRWTRYLPEPGGLRIVQADNTAKPLAVHYKVDDQGRLRAVSAQAGDGRGPARQIMHERVVDDFGREVATDNPDSGRMLRHFDAADRLLRAESADGTTIAQEHDLAGRLVTHAVKSSDTAGAGGKPQVTRYVYEGIRLVRVEHPNQVEQWAYDRLGRIRTKVLSLRLNDGTWTRSATRYRYDEQGRLTARSLPDGSELQFERNSRGQIQRVYRQAGPWAPFGWGRSPVVNALEADMVGLRRITYGNGIVGQRQRSREGMLARVAYSNPGRQAAQHERGAGVIPSAHAQPRVDATPPGAFGLETDPRALWDSRLLFDKAGNIVAQAQFAEVARLAHTALMYDAQDQLVQAVHTPLQSDAGVARRDAAVWRYHHDSLGNRLLAQEPPAVERPQRWTHSRHSNQLAGHNDAAGRSLQDPDRRYVWDAEGRLASVTTQGTTTRYRYNHSGLRVAKESTRLAQHYLYDDERHRLAELDAQGRITRQYVWLAGELLAVIDMKRPTALRAPAEGWADRLLQTLALAWEQLNGSTPSTAYVHVDHLGAPVAMTDASGQPVWTAQYAPFGRRVAEVSAASNPSGARLDLRLPGQWEDEESGLYYNDLRYYDPDAGRYISPDPLGLGGGLNSFAYVGNNPLGFSDPLGLVLFAFDGTGNGDPPVGGSAISNVVKFRNIYDSDTSMRRYYITGVGTTDRSDPEHPIAPSDYVPGWAPGNGDTLDMGGNYSGPARIERMVKYFNDAADAYDNAKVMNVDIVGFSRGAAQARDFANRVTAGFSNGLYRYTDSQGVARCQKVNFRFMGLWDTVLSTNMSSLASYNLAIPDAFSHVVQAVALNEHRGGTNGLGLGRALPRSFGNFPLESILPHMASAAPTPGKTRIEQGFIGAHSDIGGGYAPGEDQLSAVALTWMVQQAKAAGVSMGDSEQLHRIVANPLLHDESDNQYARDKNKPALYAEDRTVTYRDGSTTMQKVMPGSGMTYADTLKFINFNPPGIVPGATLAIKPANHNAGTVDMAAYLAWLRDHGYDLGDLRVK